MDQQRADVSITAFADPAENLAVAARTLPRYEAKPSGEVTARAEALWVVHREDERRCRHDADSRYPHQPPAGIRLLGPPLKSVFRLPNPYLRFEYLFEKQD